MSPNERLVLIRVKTKRAEKHFIELEAAIQAFLATKPYRVVKKINPQVGYEIGQADRVPDYIGAIVGDLVQNLRSALDHFSNQLMLVALRVEDSDWESEFPIRDTASKYETALRGIKKKGFLRDDAFNALQGVQAHERGNGKALWALHRLNCIDKHRIVLTAGASLRSVNLGAALSRMRLPSYVSEAGIRRELGTGRPLTENGRPLIADPIMNFFIRPGEIQCPLKVGDKLLVSGGLEMDPDNDFRFDIAINEPEIIQPQPVLEAVKEFMDAVSGTISAMELCLS